MITSDDKAFVEYIKRKSGKNRIHPVYAQILKIERHRRKMTLEEAAKGICSVSYLSKLENENVDGYDNEFVKTLCEKYELDYKSISQTCDVHSVVACITYFLNDDFDAIDRLYNSMNTIAFTSPQALISCIYFLVHEQFDDFKNEARNLEAIKFTLTDIECVVYLYLQSLYNMKIGFYQQAYEYLTLIATIDCESVTLRILVFEALMHTSFHLDKPVTIMKTYHELCNIMPLNYPVEKRILMKLVYDACLCADYPEEVSDDLSNLMIDKYSKVYQPMITFYKFVCRIRLVIDKSDYESIFEEITSSKFFKRKEFLGLAAVLAITINGRYFYRVVDNNYRQSSYAIDKDDPHVIFIKFVLMYASFANDKDVYEYIKDNVFPSLRMHQHFIYNQIYYNKFSELLAIDGKYRDAFLNAYGRLKDVKELIERIHVIKHN